MPLQELYPLAHFRLARLKDGEAQLTRLFDLFEVCGMPLGEDQWVLHCWSFVCRLREERDILIRLLAQHRADSKEDYWTRAELDWAQARAMHVKRRPKPGEYECYFCGHRDAKRVSSQMSICDECKIDHPDWEKYANDHI